MSGGGGNSYDMVYHKVSNCIVRTLIIASSGKGKKLDDLQKQRATAYLALTFGVEALKVERKGRRAPGDGAAAAADNGSGAAGVGGAPEPPRRAGTGTPAPDVPPRRAAPRAEAVQ